MSQKTAVSEEMTREDVAQRHHDLAEEFESDDREFEDLLFDP